MEKLAELHLAIVAIYRYMGLTHVIELTDRYWEARPADVLLLYFLVTVLIVIMPIWCVLWLFGGIGFLLFLLGGIILFLSPPLLTMAYFECVRWFR